jgi:hypothetical protein
MLSMQVSAAAKNATLDYKSTTNNCTPCFPLSFPFSPFLFPFLSSFFPLLFPSFSSPFVIPVYYFTQDI